MNTFFAIVLALVITALVHVGYRNQSLKKTIRRAEDDFMSRTIGWNELVDNYEQDFMQFEEQARDQRGVIEAQAQTIHALNQLAQTYENEHALLSDEIRAHRELCLPRLHEIRAERLANA